MKIQEGYRQKIPIGYRQKCLEGIGKNAVENNINNNNTSINKYYGEYKNVFFTDGQYEKLLKEFPNDYEERIQRLDDYMQSTGKKYKDCLATIRMWARKDKPKQQNNTLKEIDKLIKKYEEEENEHNKK